MSNSSDDTVVREALPETSAALSYHRETAQREPLSDLSARPVNHPGWQPGRQEDPI